MSRRWPDKEIELLKALRAEGLGYRRIAKRLGRNPGAIAGAVRRYIYLIPDDHVSRKTPKLRKFLPLQPMRWTEDALTETWAERKAKRAAGQ